MKTSCLQQKNYKFSNTFNSVKALVVLAYTRKDGCLVEALGRELSHAQVMEKKVNTKTKNT